MKRAWKMKAVLVPLVFAGLLFPVTVFADEQVSPSPVSVESVSDERDVETAMPVSEDVNDAELLNVAEEPGDDQEKVVIPDTNSSQSEEAVLEQTIEEETADARSGEEPAGSPADEETAPAADEESAPAETAEETEEEFLLREQDTLNGRVEIDGYEYLYRDGVQLKGFQIHDGKMLYCTPNGKIVKGGPYRLETEGNKSYYYFDKETGDLQTGWVEIDGKQHYFDEAGTFGEGLGRMAQGQKKIGGYWYMFDKSPGGGRMMTGFVHIPSQNKIVYYDEKGSMGDGLGRMLYGQQRINDAWYMFQEGSGAMRTGFYTHPNQKKTVYYSESGEMGEGLGKMQYGQKKVGGYWYYFMQGTGAMKTGFLKIASQNKIVYYNEEGAVGRGLGRMQYGQKKIGGYWYKFRQGTGAMETGFVNIPAQKKIVYYSESGEMGQGLGRMQYGQKKIGGYWYMFKQGTGAMETGFVNIPTQKKIVYYSESGEMGQGLGRMQYGQKKIGGYWYKFKQGTGAMETGFVDIPSQNKRVYYDEKGTMGQGLGRMLYGGQTINGKYYYFDKGTGALNDVRTDWRQASERLDSIGWDLRKAFNWAAGCSYQTQSTNLTSRQYADYTFRNRRGNCYGMAAVFYEMAKALGYEAYHMSGSVPLASGGYGPHSWVEVIMNGTTYVCDPDFTHETGSNGYMIHYGQSGTWRYSGRTRMR